MIPITKTRLPNFDTYSNILKRVWENGIVTNGGEMVRTLEKKLCEYLDVDYVSLVSNGTLGLMISIRALGTGERKNIITTPFTYVATAASIQWAGYEIKFVDIDPETLNLNHKLLEDAIDENTVAILPVHVYGIPCDPAIEEIAKRHNLKVVYDASHAFGVFYDSPYSGFMDRGDYSVISLHATKVLGTGEGGVIVSKTKELKERVDCLRGFGLQGDSVEMLGGLNAKMSELHASFGLACLEVLGDNLYKREKIYKRYKQNLNGYVKIHDLEGRGVKPNYSYFPIMVDNVDLVKRKLGINNISSRRYFYPSLDTVYYGDHNCPISRSTSNKILCLPLYPELEINQVDYISECLIDIVEVKHE